MTTCTFIGDVPTSVVAEIEKANLTTAAVRLSDPATVDSDFLVVHVPMDPTPDQLQLVASWLEAAGARGAQAGLTSAGGLSADLVWLLFDRSVHPVMPLNVAEQANSYAIDLFLDGVAEPSVPSAGDVKIGRFFAHSPNIVEYRKQRYMSLSSAQMQPFLQALQEAVHAMSVPFPMKLTSVPPWDPNGALADPEPKRLGPRPSLADVYRLHTDAKAKTMFQRDHQDWSVPKLLVRGESGSGKTLVAELVHDLISRRMGTTLPFVPVNCAGLTNRNLVHELFGAPKGVWTNAAVVGDLAKASYGVAFLDEIGDLAPEVQRAMLTFLGDGLIRPTGIEPFPGFIRVVAATNRDISLLIEKQQFRNDLNQRFTLQVEIPPLRERDPAELEALVDFVALNPQRNPSRPQRNPSRSPSGSTPELEVSHISPSAMTALKEHHYRDGNFRELEAIVHDGIGRARRRRSKVLQARDLAFGDPHAVTDRDAYLIRVDAPPAGPYLTVTREVDLARVAALASVPVLQAEDGSQYAVTREAVFRHLPPEPAES